MKANELMIGDWVFNNNHPTQVTRIECNSVADMECEIDIFHRTNPIPLTEEIIMKNGFKDRGGYLALYSSYNLFAKFYEEFDGRYCAITIQSTTGMLVFNKILLYVHEFQHALRLCGLNDMANNFKL